MEEATNCCKAGGDDDEAASRTKSRYNACHAGEASSKATTRLWRRGGKVTNFCSRIQYRSVPVLLSEIFLVAVPAVPAFASTWDVASCDDVDGTKPVVCNRCVMRACQVSNSRGKSSSHKTSPPKNNVTCNDLHDRGRRSL